MRRLALVLFLASVDAAASKPIAPRAFSNGLDVEDSATTSNGVVVLRAPPPLRIFIPGGTFAMGAGMVEADVAKRLCDAEPLAVLCKSNEIGHFDINRELARSMPAHPVTVSPFYLDRTEATVEQYRRCVTAGSCAMPGIPALDARFDKPEYPISHIRWDDANNYCKFVHGRLPTEAEWEFAARGEGGRSFPWGKFYNPHLCNHGSFGTDTTDATDGYARLAPVGSFKDGATSLGLMDMAGNVAEWVEDRFEPNVDTLLGYAIVPMKPGETPKPLVNPVVLKGSVHVARGGSYETPAFLQLPVMRIFLQGDSKRSDVGVRCAYDAEAFRAPELK